MSNIPQELKYNKSHEWVKLENSNTVIVGISDHAQELLGDLVFVELPEVGQELTAGDECCVVESVKAASDVYSPVTGKVVAVNDELVDSPEQVNQQPYENGWLFKLEVTNKSELDNLINAEQYEAMLAEEA